MREADASSLQACVNTPAETTAIPLLLDASRSGEPPHTLASSSQTPPLGAARIFQQKKKKMQKTSPKAGASHTLLYTAACARVFGWQLLFHPSGSIEKLNCTVWFWVLKGSWSSRQPHWCLSRGSIANTDTSGAIRIVSLH